MKAEQTIDPGKALAAYDPRQYQVIARPEDLIPLSDFVAIDVVAVPLGECADVGGGKMMPARDAIDRLAAASGIQFIEAKCSVTKLDKTTWVGRSAARRMQRDGTWSEGVAEYEWDAELRAELIATKDVVEWKNRQKTYRPKTDLDRAQDLLTARQFGRQRADTGARTRVVRLLLGIPTAFKAADVQRPLVVHRASLDARAMAADPAVRAIMAERMLGATGDVFGPGPMRDVTPEPEALPEVEPDYNEDVTREGAHAQEIDQQIAEAVADKIVDDEMGGAESFTEEEQAGIEDVFGDASGAADVEVERAWLKKELDKGLGEKGTEAVTAAIADPHLTAARGRELRESVVAFRKQQEQGGTA